MLKSDDYNTFFLQHSSFSKPFFVSLLGIFCYDLKLSESQKREKFYIQIDSVDCMKKEYYYYIGTSKIFDYFRINLMKLLLSNVFWLSFCRKKSKSEI